MGCPMTFSEAVTAIRAGKNVRRDFAAFAPGEHLVIRINRKTGKEYYAVTSPFSDYRYYPTSEDYAANDWYVFEYK